MLTNTERQQIVEEVNAGTYGIDEALDDIAAAQKGEEVRKALYAEALVLNREGHAGSTDMIARQQIANLQTSVNGQISTLRTEVGEDIDDLEAALNSGLATQNGRIAAQNATIANVVANYNVEYGSTELWASTGETGALAAGTTVTLSEDVSHFDYIDIYSFCGNSNVLDTVPVDAKLQSNAGYALRWVNLSDPGSGTYEAYVRIVETKIKITGTTLTIVHQVTYRNGSSVTISGAEITQSNRSTYVGELGIMKIVGRKITANTEIEDVRIGADGTEYASAGQAVRAQVTALESAIPAVDSTLSTQGAAADAKVTGEKVTDLKNDLKFIYNDEVILSEIIQGTYTATGATDPGRSNRLTVDGMLYVSKGGTISFNSTTGGYIGQFIVGFYDSTTKAYINESGWLFSTKLTFDNDYFIRIAFRNVNNTDITPANYDAVTKIISPVVKASQLESLPNRIPSDNQMKADLNNGCWMDLDGTIKPGTAWGMTDFMLANPNTEYHIYSFMRKNKLCGNVYIIYFDVLKRFISGVALQSISNFTTPNDCYYIVCSAAKPEMNYLYLTNNSDAPTVYKRYGQDITFNTLSKYNRSVWGNSINWAKMGVNLFGTIQNAPIYPHGSKYSFLAAMYEGFDSILIDIIKTSDGYYVVSHDDNLYPYAKNADGSSLPNPWNIRQHTLADVEALDMGYDYGDMYHGTKILRFEEALDFIKKIGMNLLVEMEYAEGLTEFRRVCETIAKYGYTDNAQIFSYYISELNIAKEVIPYAGLQLYVDGTESDIDSLIQQAITLKNGTNKVVINQYANTTNNKLTSEQIQTMIDNGLLYSVGTPTSEPTGFLNFMQNAPTTEYISMFGSLWIPANKMLYDDAISNI